MTNAAVRHLRAGPWIVAPAMPVAAMLGVVLFYLGAGQAALLHFLGIASSGVVFAYVAVLVGLCAFAVRRIEGAIPWSRYASCLAIAAAVLMLGGEGHVFYANVDWQVRDAVLADMVRWPWPFAYAGFGAPEMLRAPIGMYLVPALVGKSAGLPAAHWALLLQNSFLLGSLLALGSLLFPTTRARRIALCVILVFSGMDTIGVLLARPELVWPLDGHIDDWAPQLQYSSMLTLAFWVPHHAISGWMGGLLFLLWRRKMLPLGAFLTAAPLCLIWSPLGVMGTIPFAMLACGQAIAERSFRWTDLLLPALASLLVIPSLVYLGLDAGRVGARLVSVAPILYLLFETVEVIPILVLTLAFGRTRVQDSALLCTIASCLAIFPFVALGENDDFVMRASIPALLILALIAAERLAEAPQSRHRTLLMLVLAIGALTPAREIYRALLFRATPFPACDVAAAWQESYPEFGMHTYFARLSSLPRYLHVVPMAMAPPTHGPCYDRPWKLPR